MEDAMKIRTVVALGALGWLASRLPRDPQEWPAYAGEQIAVLREQVEEAVEAGKRASDRRMAQLDRELDEAFGSAGSDRP
jgi:hypothetical protein